MINKSTFAMIKVSYLKIEHESCYDYDMNCLSLLKMVLVSSFEPIRDIVFCHDLNIAFKIDHDHILC